MGSRVYAGDVTSYSYTGSPQTYNCTYGGKYKITLYGSKGGSKSQNGGKVEGYLILRAGTSITVTVGGTNGYNGGGSANTQKSGNNGGGATDIKINGSKVMVAGGGGGKQYWYGMGLTFSYDDPHCTNGHSPQDENWFFGQEWPSQGNYGDVWEDKDNGFTSGDIGENGGGKVVSWEHRHDTRVFDGVSKDCCSRVCKRSYPGGGGGGHPAGKKSTNGSNYTASNVIEATSSYKVNNGAGSATIEFVERYYDLEVDTSVDGSTYCGYSSTLYGDINFYATTTSSRTTSHINEFIPQNTQVYVRNVEYPKGFTFNSIPSEYNNSNLKITSNMYFTLGFKINDSNLNISVGDNSYYGGYTSDAYSKSVNGKWLTTYNIKEAYRRGNKNIGWELNSSSNGSLGSLNRNSTTVVSSSTSVTPTYTFGPTQGATDTATAQYRLDKGTINFSGNNTTKNIYGDDCTTTYSGSTSSVNVEYGTTVQIPTSGFSKKGYYFKEWNTKSDGSGIVIKPGDRISYSYACAIYNNKATQVMDRINDLSVLSNQELYSFDGNSITLYEIWEPIVYGIIYRSNDDIGDWNTVDEYNQGWVRYDEWFNLKENTFKRQSGTPNIRVDGVEITQGYNYFGWGNSNNQWSSDFVNKERIRNFRGVTEDKKVYELWALWYKDIELDFNMSGGKYNGSEDGVKLKGRIYNHTYKYNFNIVQGKTLESSPKYKEQQGQIDAYGVYNSNGVNSIYTLTKNGVTYRFIGWRLSQDADEPIWELSPYNRIGRLSTYTIYNNTTLYGTWEDLLELNLELEREVGNERERVTNLTAIDIGRTLNLTARAGEKCKYTIVSRSNGIRVNVEFCEEITKIYDVPGVWTDELNPSSHEDKVTNQKHGLNREFTTIKSANSREFHIPKYLGTDRSYPGNSGRLDYTVKFKFSKPSYYYRKVYNKEEETSVKGNIHLIQSGGSNTVLDDLRTKLKTKVN